MLVERNCLLHHSIRILSPLFIPSHVFPRLGVLVKYTGVRGRSGQRGGAEMA